MHVHEYPQQRYMHPWFMQPAYPQPGYMQHWGLQYGHSPQLYPQQGWGSGTPHASARPDGNTGHTWNEWRDSGGQPFVVDIEEAAERNPFYRMALWTGNHLQVTLMSIPVGGDIGLELHPDVDQFIRLEQGHGLVQMGESKDRLHFVRNVSEDDAIMIPAGTWHNLINVGHVPLKLYSIYAPPEHPFGTVHRTKAEAEAAHQHP